MLKGIFFDLYDTLVVTREKTASTWLISFYSCLKEIGLTQSLEDFMPCCQGFFSWQEPPPLNDGLTVYERRIQAFCENIKLDIDDKKLRKIATSTVLAANAKCDIDPDCRQVLETLRKKFKIALISNYDHPPYITKLLRELDIAKYFSAVVISGDVGVKKPDPAIFHIGLQQIGLKPDEVVHVGDSLDDVLGAASAGVTPVLIQRCPVLKDKFIWDKANHTSPLPPQTKIIRQLPDLLPLVIPA
ncbi:MAG TPA: HAD family hydrolase [Dehalococcoidales bacterium]|nr:HAD family hydrolase [Dehalococcoidales bacterium]